VALPDRRVKGGGVPVRSRHMPVDPQLQQLLDVVNAMESPTLSELGPVQARALFKTMMIDGEPEPVGVVTELMVPGPVQPIGVRVYEPSSERPADGWPVLAWFHGGGFVIGDLDTADTTCRKLCTRARAEVVSVDYRLAPEHPHPAAADDCWAVTQWMASPDGAAALHADPSRLAVGGDSAGGNLAAVVAMRARDADGPPLRHQLLVYPTVDLTMSAPSIRENGEGYFLTEDAMAWFSDCYIGAGDRRGPDVSPLFAAELSGVAPACVLTAEFDPLRDEGEQYVKRLADAGVAVRHERFDSMIHGFFAMGSVTPVADQAVTLAADALRAALP